MHCEVLGRSISKKQLNLLESI